MCDNMTGLEDCENPAGTGFHSQGVIIAAYLGFVILSSSMSVVTNLIIIGATLQDKSMHQSRGYFRFGS